ncbi:PNPLA domain-containing protein [Caenorhabditis elegans]|uniref:PNPLA domain-containing protein n=1 Tax=Caenorhabditis elegans TaxID=6239 RepID=Q9N5Z7_CAEEL|nr:PNPLA domain-containing protein [Caenorhabditis elegans]CCD62148.1 PNPLA domain-containing protein [Caenorhabditis elegans]|eukprot:NP_497474.3 Uncharacterized protein CELE_B0524.2 [Caenorhabditis elegans]
MSDSKKKSEEKNRQCDDSNVNDTILIAFSNYSEVYEWRTSAGNNEKLPESSTSSDSDSDSDKKNVENVVKLKKEMPLRKARDPANRTPLKDAKNICLSFGGCGFLGSYQFGAAKMIFDHGKKLMKRVERYSGCSSGSLVAAMFIFNPEKISEAVEEIYKMADEVNDKTLGAMSPGFVISDRLRKVVEKFLPDDVAKANDLLFVSVTKLKTWKNELISNFESKIDLIDCLMASCYHPMYSSGLNGKAPILRGEAYIDGGYSNMIPEFLDMRTVTVSAFAGDADICPVEKSALFNDFMFAFFNQNMKLTLSNMKRVTNALFPPTRAILQEYFNAGARDAEKLLKDSGFYE